MKTLSLVAAVAAIAATRTAAAQPVSPQPQSARAAVGVQVETTGTKRDTLGVFIAGVTPGGPAENAGIIEGDRIAGINGTDLRVSAADVDDSYMSGVAAHRLTREMQKITPGTRVTLRVWSGGRFRDVQVTTVKSSELADHRGMRYFGDEMAIPNIRIFRDGLPQNIQPRVLIEPPTVERRQ
jgi:S1-C subfamily serine protease